MNEDLAQYVTYFARGIPSDVDECHIVIYMYFEGRCIHMHI